MLLVTAASRTARCCPWHSITSSCACKCDLLHSGVPALELPNPSPPSPPPPLAPCPEPARCSAEYLPLLSAAAPWLMPACKQPSRNPSTTTCGAPCTQRRAGMIQVSTLGKHPTPAAPQCMSGKGKRPGMACAHGSAPPLHHSPPHSRAATFVRGSARQCRLQGHLLDQLLLWTCLYEDRSGRMHCARVR